MGRSIYLAGWDIHAIVNFCPIWARSAPKSLSYFCRISVVGSPRVVVVVSWVDVDGDPGDGGQLLQVHPVVVNFISVKHYWYPLMMSSRCFGLTCSL